MEKLNKNDTKHIAAAPSYNFKIIIASMLLLFTSLFFFWPFLSCNFVFDPSTLQSIVKDVLKEHADSDTETITWAIAGAVKDIYPDYITYDPDYKPTWIYNNAGGAMGAMIVLHASITEYIIIFGTTVGTEGHSGRFFAEDYFTIIVGEQWAYRLGTFEPEIYKPGDQNKLAFGDSIQYKMPERCFALEYARGNIVSMFPFGLIESFTSTFDIISLYQTVKTSAVMISRNLLHGKI